MSAGLRILEVGSSMPKDWGGIERYVAVLSQALARSGHAVTVTAPSGSPLFLRAGVETVALSVSGKYDFAGCAAYLRLFRHRRFDVVNTHFSPDYLMPAYAARMASQRGLVLTRHVAVTLRPSRVRAYSRLYERFIAVSGAVREGMVEAGFLGDRVSTVLAGVPPLKPKVDRDSARTGLGVGADMFAIGAFGRLVPEKGQATLIQAMKSLGDDVTCHIFGDGPDRAGLERLATGTSTVFHGFVPEVDDAMAAMDVLALPSVWVEALGLAVLEAMSVGRPIVASRVGGVPEVVQDGVTGLLVPPGDSGSLAAAIMRLKSDPGLCRRMGEAGRKLHAENFTPGAFAARVAAVYADL